MQPLLTWFHNLPDPVAEWLTLLGAAWLALIAAAIAYRIGSRLLTRTTRGHHPAEAIVQSGLLPARWLLPLMALSVVWHGAPDDLHGVEGLRRLTALAMVGCATWLIARGIHRVSAAYRRYLQRLGIALGTC